MEPRTRKPNPLKKGLIKLSSKIESMSIMEYLFFIALFLISIVIVISLMEGFSWFYIKTEGIIPTTIVISIFILIIFIAGFLFTLKHKSKHKEVRKEFDATTIIWSCLTGLLTTYIGFSVSLYTSELIKKEEDKEKVAALLDLYVAKYEHEKQEVNNTYSFYSSFGPEIIELIDTSTATEGDKAMKKLVDTFNTINILTPQVGQKRVIGKENFGNTEEIIEIKEPFLSFISQNIDLYSKLSPRLQECIQNWEMINDLYNIELINDGYPIKSENSDMSKKLLNQKRAEYLITMTKVNNEINKRSIILKVEQQYLRGEISKLVHDNYITFYLAFYSKVNLGLNSIQTVEDYEKYKDNYYKTESEIKKEIIKKIDKEEGIFYTY